MADEPTTSNCTIRLLAIAAQAAYRVKKDDRIDPNLKEDYKKTLDDIAAHGYTITEAVAPKNIQGTGTTPLAAACLKPQDGKSPIIITFRGTSTKGDVVSDIRLGVSGVTEKKFRDAAFEFYQKVRRENPTQEIILTGHSLGGHLAQYVATKAYNLDKKLKVNPVVQVRTFNTAPVSTRHNEAFQDDASPKSSFYAQFVNYRLSPDVVSSLPLQKYTGNTFVFPCEKNWFKAHLMKSIANDLPEVILNQSVGTTHISKKHNMLIELTQGLLHSYQCRVQGQYFSRLRAGKKNLEIMQRELPKILEKMKTGTKNDFDDAYRQLADLKNNLNGKTSKHIIDVLMESTKVVKIDELKKAATQGASTIQREMKAQLTTLRESESKDSLTREESFTSEAISTPTSLGP